MRRYQITPPDVLLILALVTFAVVIDLLSVYLGHETWSTIKDWLFVAEILGGFWLLSRILK